MGYELKPGATSSISAGGEYDNLDTTSTQTYNNISAESAAAAALSAAAALASQTAAAASAAAALTSKNAAATSATNAATSETNALASKNAAATSATNAATSATNASTSATSASTSATTATTQAGIATTQATNAATSATAAQTAQTAAEAARDAALAAYDNFDDRYLGQKASDPTVDNDGNPLLVGALYFNTTVNAMRVYTGSVWVDAYSSGTTFLAKANNLSDLPSAATARTNLGLGTAATTNSTAYATAAQGALADSAIQVITSVDGSVVISPTGTTRDLSVGTAANTATLIAQVRNQTGSTLTKGTLVYISGAAGNKCLVSPAQANAEATSSKTFGMIQADIATNNNGFVVISGIVSGLDTSAYADGATLYLSPTTAGGYTSTKPSAPNHLVYVGVVTYSHANQGAIQTRIQNGYELDEIHDVSITSVATNDFLVRNGSNLWVNQTPSTARTSMGLGSAALNNTADFDPAGTAVALAIALG